MAPALPQSADTPETHSLDLRAEHTHERLGVNMLIDRHLIDLRTGRNRQFVLADLFRQSVYSRLAGYEDTSDAERLAEDPIFRMLAFARAQRDQSRAHVNAALIRNGSPHRGADLSGTGAAERRPGAARGDPAAHAARDPRYRQLGESGARRRRAVSVQRPLRVRLLPSPLRLRPGRRLLGRHAPLGERPQCQGVGGGAPSDHWPAPSPA